MDRRRFSKALVTVVALTLLPTIALVGGCEKRGLKMDNTSYDKTKAECDHNLKESAVGLLLFKAKYQRFPSDLGEMARLLDIDNRFIQCRNPISGEVKQFSYHKPDENSSEDFVVLECSNHPGQFKYRLKNIGADVLNSKE